MNELTAGPDDIDAYGRAAAGAAAQIATAGGFDLAANVAALIPAFGPIGADFVARFGAVQATHARTVTDLAGHYAATAAAAHACAAGYRATDSTTAATFAAVEPGATR